MSKCTQNAPNLHPICTEAGAFVSSCAYALLLNTRLGHRTEREHTWFVVMLGVLMTLGWLALEDPKAARRAFFYFVITGLPIIARALWLQSADIDALLDRGIGSHGTKT